jgi:hypothetical protein
MKAVNEFEAQGDQQRYAKQEIWVDGRDVDKGEINGKTVDDVSDPTEKQYEKDDGSCLSGRCFFQLLIK